MQVSRFFLCTLFIASCLCLPLSAQPSESRAQAAELVTQPKSPDLITRSQLVTDVERVLSQWEAETANYATKAELNELRQLIFQMKDELSGLDTRTNNLEMTTDGIDQRVQHTRRPGF